MAGLRWMVLGLVITTNAGSALADRATAKKLTDQAVKQHYRNQEWAEAIAGYRAALAADPSYVTAHYYIASAASLLGDLPTVRSELGWMWASKDKEAKRLLKVALKDPDLQQARRDDDIRKLLGLLPVGPMTPTQRLLADGGVWTVDYSWEFGHVLATLTFKPGGKVTAKGSRLQPDDEAKINASGSWTLAPDGSLSMAWSKLIDGTFLAEEMKPCKGKLPGTCFVLATEDDAPEGRLLPR